MYNVFLSTNFPQVKFADKNTKFIIVDTVVAFE